MLAAGLCSARRRVRTLGLPADSTLRSRDTDGSTRCPFRLVAIVSADAYETPAPDDTRVRRPGACRRPQPRAKAGANRRPGSNVS
jgi:hypothetical protein